MTERLRVLRVPAVGPVNPYQRELYERLRAHGVDLVTDVPLTPWSLLRHRRAVDAVHAQWRIDRLFRIADDGLDGAPERAHSAPVAALRLARLAVAVLVARALGVRIAWTVHEPFNHRPDGRRLDHLAGRLLARHADALMAHDHASAELARRYLRPRRPVAVLPLPGYAGVMPPPRPGAREAVRAELGAGPADVVVLAFGLLRPEKELQLLVAALEELRDPRLRVVVAGEERSTAVTAMLRAAAEHDPRLLVRVGWMDDRRAAELFAAADLSVLARSVDWTSASPVLSLSLGVPAVVASLRSTRELLGPGAWYFAPGDAASLAAQLAAAVAAGPRARAARGAAGRAHVGRWDYDDLAAATALALRGELAPTEPARRAADLTAA